jgi:periplasmic protein TonB
MPATLEQPVVRARASDDQNVSASTVSMTPVITFVLWSGCIVVGLVGIVLPYARPFPLTKEKPPIQAEMVQVELSNDPLPPIAQPERPSVPQPPVMVQIPPLPREAPNLTPVAEPSAVAFALPVEGPVVLVEPTKATFAAVPVAEPKPVVAPPVQVLTYGQGDGRQPAPEYPLRARREGQEGIVGIRFCVGEDGRVLTAEASSPSPWKLLNDSALRAVREHWRFSTGPLRLYEVSIRFQLTK